MPRGRSCAPGNPRARVMTDDVGVRDDSVDEGERESDYSKLLAG